LVGLRCCAASDDQQIVPHHPVPIERIVPDQNMNHPDTIKAGWTIQKIWMLWFAFVGMSFVASALMVAVPVLRRRKIDSYSADLVQ
jgi:hypothetical protein